MLIAVKTLHTRATIALSTNLITCILKNVRCGRIDARATPVTSSIYGQAYQSGFERTIRFLISRGVGRDDAQEVSQAAWARGWECLEQLRDDDLVLTWVNTIALNIYRRALHSERLRQPLPELFSKLTINVAAIDIDSVLQSCQPRERHLLELQMHGATAKEIAQDDGVTETTVRIRLMRARRAARARLEARAHRRRIWNPAMRSATQSAVTQRLNTT
jgi:RNA polymerase sigma factor (sigma-70 family)